MTISGNGNMGILNIRKAERAGARVVIGIAGISGSGKTFSALQLAWGLAGGDASKVGFLDSENRRGSLYADILKGKDGKVHQFLIGDLDAPFSPQRYIDAILEFQAAGVEVLVIDSVSHEWAGLGGVLDVANASGRNGAAKWKEPKGAHKKFMNTLLTCDMHIIVCLRATNKVDWTDPKNPKALGVMPVQQEEFLFEMTASMMMWNGGRSREIMKCPEDLVAIFGKTGDIEDGYLTARHGLQMRNWIDGGVAIDGTAEKARNALRVVAEKGADAITAAWAKLPDDARQALGGSIPSDIMSAAEEFDRQRVEAQPGGADLADLNDEILNDAA